jgi:hypothetical protein
MRVTGEERRSAERGLCRLSPLYWLTNYGCIKDERTGSVHGPGLALWPGQAGLVARVCAGEWVITGKARQIGVSWLLRNLEAWELLFAPDVRLGIIAQDEEHARLHLARVQWIVQQQPSWLSPRRPAAGYASAERLGLAAPGRGLAGLSVLEAHPCTSSAARGISGKRIVCEELAFWPDAEAVWAGLVGAVADAGGQVVVASTASGTGNKYHALWREAEAGQGRFTPLFFPWRTHPQRDDAWYARTLQALGSRDVMQQEYPATPDEMFRAGGHPYFDRSAVEHLTAQHRREPQRTLYGGEWRIYAEPQAGREYVIGADVADGGGDACSADVLDTATAEQAAHLHSYAWRAHEFADHLAELGRMYGTALLGVERNNSGLATLTVLARERHYPRLYRQPAWDTARWQESTAAGWLTDAHSRPALLGGIARALSRLDLAVHDAESLRQLAAFQHNLRTRRPDAPDGDRDDAVISLGIAQQLRLYAQERTERGLEVYLGEERV